MELPELTLAICTYKRPWYGVLTLQSLIHKVHYAGAKRFIVSDGGSTQEELDAYRTILQGHNFEIVVTDNLSAMMNAAASKSGEVWLTTLDDFMPRRDIDVTPDVRFLLANPDVGAVRMGRLAFFEHGPGEEIHAQLRMLGGLHWWTFHKQATTHPYISCINTFLWHRRYWDYYGDIPLCPPHIPGEAEVEIARAYNNRPDGPTIAVPMRFGEDCAEWGEAIWHFGTWRSNEYTEAGGGRRM